MKTNCVRAKWAAALLALAVLAWICFTANGGSLEPNEPPGPTMRTLEEVYGAVKVGAGPIMAGDERWVGSMVITGFPGSYNIGPDTNVMKVIDIYQDGTPPPVGGGAGSAVLSPITVTMNIDKSSPLLWQKLCEGTSITDIEIKLYKQETDTSPYYTITLQDVKVSKMASRMVYKGNGKYSHLDVVDLDYTRITWRWEPSGTEYTYIKAG